MAEIVVGLGELRVTNDPAAVLVAYGLGSCVGVCAYDPVSKVGGMLHAMLPQAPASDGRQDGIPSSKYVDTGIRNLLAEMGRLGAQPRRLVFKIAGGARMLSSPGFSNVFDIGSRNVEAARRTMAEVGLPLYASDTGGGCGRTVRLAVKDGRVVVRTLGQEREL